MNSGNLTVINCKFFCERYFQMNMNEILEKTIIDAGVMVDELLTMMLQVVAVTMITVVL